MKLKFKHQGFQRDAARAVTDIFIGQRKSDGFSYLFDEGRRNEPQLKLKHETLAYRNEPIMLDRKSLVENIREIQMGQDLNPIENIVGDGLNFTIEMETGTGKTYTYIKTMYELNKLYGWSKFIIVVPSIAIREGVVKSLDIMQEHFAEEYGKRMEYFVYDSKNLSQIESFALDANLHVMVINTQAFNARGADARRFTSRLEEFGWRVPLEVVAATNPILIIDEPQSVLGVDRNNATRQKLKEFNPLFSLLYSATHRKEDIYNQVYRLDAIDALNKKLVKKIEVLGVKQQGSTATHGFVYLEDIIIGKNGAAPQARISYDVKTGSGVKTTSKLVTEGFDLFQQSGELEEYRNGYVIDRIDGVNGFIHLLNDTTLYIGEMVGAINEELIRRIQIRETIRTHIERERKLFYKGIKVLSLFFIDHVENYRLYDNEGTKLGRYAEIFEEEYARVISEMMPTFEEGEYIKYLQRIDATRTHQGYFSRDKKGNFINSKVERGSTDSADVDAYSLIMKDKEALLSLDPKVKGSEVRFIFSHSALKEGWDNPNVFQICTLKNSDNETKKRQEVGRGMRLCVNQNGERQDEDLLGSAVFDTNILTIIASESYEDFSRGLQDELASAISSRPAVVSATLFEGRTIVFASGEKKTLSSTQAAAVNEELVANGYVRKGKLTPKYFEDKQQGTLDFGDYNDAKESIVSVLDKVFNPDQLAPDNARKNREAKFIKEKFDGSEFQKLWKRINTRTFYTVDFETSELIENSVSAIDKYLNVTEIRIVVGTGSLESISSKEALAEGTAMKAGKVRTIHVNEAVGGNVKYDLVGRIVENTGLTRRAIVDILTKIKPTTFAQFKLNPEEFIIKVSKLINEVKAFAVVKHIEYHKLDDTFDETIFTENTIRGKLGENAIESFKSLYDLVVVDSVGTEKPFAEKLEREDNVVVYTKLPRGFYINTPMGHYNPDWAIAFKEGSVKHIYFVAETKGASKYELKTADLRDVEESKIECARRHFASISGSDVKFEIITSYEKLYDMVTK